MIKRFLIISCVVLVSVPYVSAFGQDQELELFLEKAYEQKRKNPTKAIFFGLVPSAGHAYVGFDSWSSRGIFFLLGEAACITVSATLGYGTQQRSIGPGIYEEWENQPTPFLYVGIMALTFFKIYELWDINQQVERYNQEIKQRYDLSISNTDGRTKIGMALYY